MLKKNKPYDKQKSFINLYVTKSQNEFKTLNLLRQIFENKKFFLNLSDYQKKILNNVKEDIFHKSKRKKYLRLLQIFSMN